MKALLIDITKCIGCRSCDFACKEQNKLPETEDKDLTDKTFTLIQDFNGVYVRKMCRHCLHPTCVSVCPVGALYKTEEGPVLYDPGKCMGCRYCMMACPFRIPRYEWDSVFPRVRKCIFCADRLKAGKQTACAEACPTGATKFGDRDELIKEARSRISGEPGKYIDHIYGEKEIGGTSVLYLSSIPFSKLGVDYGFRSDVTAQPLPTYTWSVLSEIPYEVAILAVALGGIRWITNRRDEVKKAEGGRGGKKKE